MVWDPSQETSYLSAGNLRGSSSTEARTVKKRHEITKEDLLRESDSIDNSQQARQPRRRKRKWSSLEEETLRAGVKMYALVLNLLNHNFPGELS
ncbi:hypothetical protein JHK87_039714 [Glycine soja]|nr:hypothetical protein JHK87_039714 [Glycine soja]